MAFSKDDIARLWVQEGGNPAAARTAAAVALAESSGKQSATNHNTNGTVDKGLFQINSIHGKLSTYDLTQNVRAAIKISQNGQNWTPWVTYKTGAYKKFLSPGQAPSSSTASDTGPGVDSRSVGTTTRTIPGKSFAAERGAAIQQFLGTGRNDSQNNLDFALQIRSLQDTPSRTVAGPSRTGIGGGSGSPAGSPNIDQIQQRANALDSQHLPYKWGGGHGATPVDPHNAVPVDCSGAVSSVLGVDPRVSEQFAKFGKPGRAPSGKGVTIYASGTHVLMEINGHFFGTSKTNPGGGAGWIPRAAISPAYLKGFTARHL